MNMEQIHAQFAAMLRLFDNATIRLFSGPKAKVATCVLGDPAFVQDGTLATARPIRPDPHAIGGEVKGATVQLNNGNTIPLSVGLVGSGAAIELQRLKIKPGEQVGIPAMIIRGDFEQQIRDVIDKAINPQASGKVSIYKKADKDAAFVRALETLQARGQGLNDGDKALARDMADHGTTAEAIVSEFQTSQKG